MRTPVPPPRFERRGRSPHKRNTGPMRDAPRCEAKTRNGTPCKSPRVHGRPRCRMHGGASGSGARPGNRNALKHGRYSAREAARRRRLLADSQGHHLTLALVAALEEAPAWPKPAELPELYDIVVARQIETYDALTLALTGTVGITVWRDAEGYGAAFHRLGTWQAKLLGRKAMPSYAVLMCSDDPAHRIEPGPFKVSLNDGLLDLSTMPLDPVAAEVVAAVEANAARVQEADARNSAPAKTRP